MDRKCVTDAFREQDYSGDGWIDQAELEGALAKLGIPEANARKLFNIMDRPGDGRIDYKDFITRLYDNVPDTVQEVPHTPVAHAGASLGEQERQRDDKLHAWSILLWAQSLPFHVPLGEALKAPPGEDDFLHLQKLAKDQSEVQRLLKGAKLEGLSSIVYEGLRCLRDQAAATGAELNEKLIAKEALFEMSYGGLDKFYGGLTKLIGPPRMINGSLLEAIEVEHCRRPDSNEPFTSTNGMTTTSSEEYEFVVEPKEGKKYKEREGFPDNHPNRSVPRPLQEFKQELDAKNAELERLAAGTQLLKEELITGRLYTGPMYEKYNVRLRAASGVSLLVTKCEKMCKGNSYSTTIHSINSCIIKLSKLMQACEVWRGFTNAKLPESFWKENGIGICGGIEFGFSSTTREEKQANDYATGKASTVFHMTMGMIDRGADMSWLSQYPHEREILFPPLLGIQVLQTKVSGRTLQVEARLSLNLMSETLEQVLQKRHKLVSDLAESILLEVNVAKPGAVGLSRIVESTLGDGPLRHDPKWYNIDENFEAAIAQSIQVKKDALVDLSPFVLQESDEVQKFAQTSKFYELYDKMMRDEGDLDMAAMTVAAQELEKTYESAIERCFERTEGCLLQEVWRVCSVAIERNWELYTRTWASICDEELAGGAAYCAEVELLQKKVFLIDGGLEQHIPPDRNPVTLTQEACRVSGRFEAMLKRVIGSCVVANDFQLSSTVVALDRNVEVVALQRGQVPDAVLSFTVVCRTLWAMSCLLRGLSGVASCEDLVVQGVVEGFFGLPEQDGWRQCTVCFSLPSDIGKHVARLELHHKRMSDAYLRPVLHARVRNAMELLRSKVGNCALDALGLAQFHTDVGPWKSLGEDWRESSDSFSRVTNGTAQDVYLTDCSWTSDAPLKEWEGISVDCAGHVTDVSLRGMGLQSTVAWGRGLQLLGHLSHLDLTGNDELLLPPGAPTSLIGEKLYTNREKVTEALGVVVNQRCIHRYQPLVDKYGPDGPALFEIFNCPGGPCSEMSEDRWFREGRPMTQWCGVKSLAPDGRVKELELRLCPCGAPAAKCLGYMRGIVKLSLKASSLASLPDEIGYLHSLKELNLEETDHLKNLPEAIGKCAALEIIDLANSAIKALPDSIGDLQNLKQLILSDTSNFETLPKSIGKCVALELINLACSPAISTLPDGIGDLKHLKQLILCDTKSLETLPEAIGKCVALERIDLASSAISALPNGIGNLQSLKELNLVSTNNLETLPESIGKCRALETINLTHSSATSALPDCIGDLQNLKQLIR